MRFLPMLCPMEVSDGREDVEPGSRETVFYSYLTLVLMDRGRLDTSVPLLGS